MHDKLRILRIDSSKFAPNELSVIQLLFDTNVEAALDILATMMEVKAKSCVGKDNICDPRFAVTAIRAMGFDESYTEEFVEPFKIDDGAMGWGHMVPSQWARCWLEAALEERYV